MNLIKTIEDNRVSYDVEISPYLYEVLKCVRKNYHIKSNLVLPRVGDSDSEIYLKIRDNIQKSALMATLQTLLFFMDGDCYITLTVDNDEFYVSDIEVEVKNLLKAMEKVG